MCTGVIDDQMCQLLIREMSNKDKYGFFFICSYENVKKNVVNSKTKIPTCWVKIHIYIAFSEYLVRSTKIVIEKYWKLLKVIKISSSNNGLDVKSRFLHAESR